MQIFEMRIGQSASAIFSAIDCLIAPLSSMKELVFRHCSLCNLLVHGISFVLPMPTTYKLRVINKHVKRMLTVSVLS